MERVILGVRFTFLAPQQIVANALKGGLLVAPSGPGLAVDFVCSDEYRQALQTADFVLPDSGWMCLLWRVFNRETLPRISGLAFVNTLVNGGYLRDRDDLFWILPSPRDADATRKWAHTHRVCVEPENTYIAPIYSREPIDDPALVGELKRARPSIIILAIGGGVQERVGLAIRRSLDYRPTILCIGAALAFVTGQQVHIPSWADRLYLGWLFRIASSPTTYLPRYISAVKLARSMWKYRSQPPPLASNHDKWPS